MKGLEQLQREIIACTLCPRLVAHRQGVAKKRPLRYRDWTYWGRPLPGFGDPHARLLILGLAPAAHGGNRTGRMFTGDRSGEWLISTLHQFGFANQPYSIRLGDGLSLQDVYISATLRCVPPQNKPKPSEIRTCRPYLLRELRLLGSVKVLVALGRIAFDAALSSLQAIHQLPFQKKPPFGHGRSYALPNGGTLVASFHPSQPNTQTFRLTREMFDAIFAEVRDQLDRDDTKKGTSHRREEA